MPSPPFGDPARVAFTALDFVSVVTAVLATRRMMAVYLESANAAHAGSLLVLLMGAYEYLLVVGNWALAYPYDLPQLALFSCALMHLVRGEAFYYLFFVLACLNRETALFLVVIHGLFRLGPDLDAALIAREPGGLRRLAAGCRCWAPHLLAQAAILLLARSAISWAYRGNKPETADFVHGLFSIEYATKNISHLLNPIYWPAFLSNFAYLWLVVVLGFRFLRPPGLRWSLLVVPPWVVAMFFVGVMAEMRVFGELIPLMAVCVAVIVDGYLRASGFRLRPC